ncbi:hypothetical protein EXS61_02470 [Candidatus Parcubacteria bacterium]|nr:hypothetical protein [Candidatus Parcubacteria bacterium]
MKNGNGLSPEIIRVISEMGFVRVTGLAVGSRNDRIKARESEYGRWESNNSLLCFVTMDGQVFSGSMKILFSKRDQFVKLMGLLCPHGEGGVYVHFSNAERICSLVDLFERIATPHPEDELA